ncbi:hypothetical protein DPMN_177397 [Dreissena polymorpha]|uniref:Uncharacterized protein n=1 Tax=Dreissena polymorpha TaxID=45954 RepID=A0A9D4IHT1_DREPO|nr:hypothetical protein DPMN_177397 [Dreissena polymorpha]
MDVELNSDLIHRDTTGSAPSQPHDVYVGQFMNPDTQYIENTMAAYNKQTNDCIADVRMEVQAVRHEMLSVKKDLCDINEKIGNIELKQHTLSENMKSLENKVGEIENEQYNIRSEFEEVAHMSDKDSAELNEIGKRLEKIEYAEIKNCLRIFGLTDEENEAADKT